MGGGVCVLRGRGEGIKGKEAGEVMRAKRQLLTYTHTHTHTHTHTRTKEKSERG